MSDSVSVFANGIWKSGNHLLVKLCELLDIPPANFGVASSLMLGKYHLVRQIIRGAKFERYPYFVGLDAPVSVSKLWLNYKVKSLRGTCIGGHSAYSDQLLGMLQMNNVRPIQIVRDPRDVVCSFAHWIVTRPDYYAYPAFSSLSLEDRILVLLNGNHNNSCPLESFATVLDRSYGWVTQPDKVLVVRFEDLVGNSGGGDSYKQLDSINKVVQWCELQNVDVEEIASKLFGGTKTFRKGKISGWEDDFSVSVRKIFDERIGDRLELWGYN